MVLKAAVRGLDALLRLCYGIYEFSQDPNCFLRLALVRSNRDLTLTDGTVVRRGDPIGDLHLWNERVPRLPPGGPNLAWARVFVRQARRSLEELAARAETDPRLRDVHAFRAVGSLMTRQGLLAPAALAVRLGFEVVEWQRPRGLWPRFAQFWENGFNLALVWAYNAPSLKSREFSRLRRVQLWTSKQKLIEKYGGRERAQEA